MILGISTANRIFTDFGVQVQYLLYILFLIMTNSIQNPRSSEDLYVEFSVNPRQCLCLMDALIYNARDYASSWEEESICELYDIYEDLSCSLNKFLTDQFDLYSEA